MTETIEALTERYIEFLEARNWRRFHTPQNLSMALSVESNELLELFLWYDNPSAEHVLQDEELTEKIGDELADVFIYTLGLAYQLDMDILTLAAEKMNENEERFSEEKVKQINQTLEEWQ